MPESSKARSVVFEWCACVGLAVLLLVACQHFVRRLQVGAVVAGVIGLVVCVAMMVGLAFHIRAVRREAHGVPVEPVVAYIAWKLWLFVLILFGIAVAGLTAIGVYIEKLGARAIAWAIVWWVGAMAVMIPMARRLRGLLDTEPCRQVDKRLEEHGWKVQRGRSIGAEMAAKPMRMRHVPTTIAMLALFFCIGVGMLVVAATMAARGWQPFVLVPLGFGLAFTIVPACWMRQLLRILRGATADEG
jgi:hypothetical protein